MCDRWWIDDGWWCSVFSVFYVWRSVSVCFVFGTCSLGWLASCCLLNNCLLPELWKRRILHVRTEKWEIDTIFSLQTHKKTHTVRAWSTVFVVVYHHLASLYFLHFSWEVSLGDAYKWEIDTIFSLQTLIKDTHSACMKCRFCCSLSSPRFTLFLHFSWEVSLGDA